MTKVRSKTEALSLDTLRENVIVVVMDTIREITTVTVRESDTGDTLRITTVTDRTRASSRDRYHDTQEKLSLRTDTIYVERQQSATSTVAVATTSAEITPDGAIRPKGVMLKWVFFILVAIVALVIVLRIFVFRR
jgi:hypothetical protein